MVVLNPRQNKPANRGHQPVRTCVGCGARRRKWDLLRCVRVANGTVAIDPEGKRPGRGGYLCPSRECLEKARKRNGLSRPLKMRVPPEFYDRIADYFDEQALEAE